MSDDIPLPTLPSAHDSKSLVATSKQKWLIDDIKWEGVITLTRGSTCECLCRSVASCLLIHFLMYPFST